MTRAHMEIVYSSDVMIWSPEELATLAIFYDKIALPAATAESARHFVEFELQSDDHLRLTASSLSPLQIFTPTRVVERADLYVEDWERTHNELFTAGVLTRLREPDQEADGLSTWLSNPRAVHMNVSELSHYCDVLIAGNERLFYVRQDHLRHLLRTDISEPAVFAGPTASYREVLKALLAMQTFKYLLPAVKELNPAEILAVRSKVSDTREGFAMHLQSLSREVETRLDGGEPVAEIVRYARSVVETTLIPDYREFRRQILAERSGFWLKVLDASRKAFEIEVAPWTPSFYAQVLNVLGVTFLTTSNARRDSLSNHRQAFQFMASVEQSLHA